MKRAALGLPIVLVVLALSPAALASATFPDEIKAQLMLTDPPMCTICHRDNTGGTGSVTKAFGRNLMIKYGLQEKDIAGLHNAITQNQKNGDNVDGDAVPDIAELIQGTDPNVPEGGVAAEEPQFGCQCTAARARSGFSAAGAACLTALVVTGFRRKSGARRRHERQR